MSVKFVALFAASLLLAGCVAPEDPAAARRPSPTAAVSTPPPANLEDAPVPNRRVRGPTDNTIRVVQ